MYLALATAAPAALIVEILSTFRQVLHVHQLPGGLPAAVRVEILSTFRQVLHGGRSWPGGGLPSR